MDGKGILKKLSGRDDIDTLFRRFGQSTAFDIKTFHVTQYQYANKLWDNYSENKKFSELNFYDSMIKVYWSEISYYFENNVSFSRQMDLENISSCLKNSFRKKLFGLSTEIFKSEMKNHNIEQDEYFQKLGYDYNFYNSLISKYPYWFFLINRFLSEETEYLLTFLRNLKMDYMSIALKFFDGVMNIKQINVSTGDRHQGRFVIEIVSDLGDFFYKPRSAKIDGVFKDILYKISSENSDILDMVSPEFIDCGEYSWFKKVEYELIDSDSKEGMKNYYKRLGQLLCITYILNGADLHYENIISHGEYPVIIDTEPLLTSRLRFKKALGTTYLQNDAVNYIEDSVRNSLILPNVFSIKNQYFEFSPFKIFDDLKPNTQEDLKKEYCHIVQKEELLEVSSYIKEGFTVVYQEIFYNKENYLSLFKKLLKDMSVRFLNKPTDDYAKVMELLKSPVCLNNFEIAFATSARILTFDSTNILTEELEEQREILNLNIPYFEISVSSNDLILSSNKVIKDYFIESPLNCLTHKMDILCEEDLFRQIRIIEEVFLINSKKFAVNELYRVRNNEDFKEKTSSHQSEKLEQQVTDIFNSMTVNPLTGQFHWNGPELEGNLELGEFYYRSVDYPNSYYTGSVGMFRGLLNLNENKRYDIYINKVINDIRVDIDQILNSNSESINIGAYNGLSQYIRFYTLLYRINKLEKYELENQMLDLLHLIRQGIKKDTKLDILDGTAGIAKTLIELYYLELSDNLKRYIIELLQECREHLIKSIKEQNGELYFPFEQNAKKFFTGYAHGSAGIIASLYKLGRVLNYDDRILIKSLLDTERKLYDPVNRGWFKDNSKSEYCWGWCHGIPGILLSRVELLSDGYEDALIIQEIRDLYEISLEKSFGTNLTFCHGDLGNAVICRYTEEKLSFQNSFLDDYLGKLEPYLLEAKKYCIRGSEAPGLMHGLIGITSFAHMMSTGNLSSMIDILKITSL